MNDERQRRRRQRRNARQHGTQQDGRSEDRPIRRRRCLMPEQQSHRSVSALVLIAMAIAVAAATKPAAQRRRLGGRVNPFFRSCLPCAARNRPASAAATVAAGSNERNERSTWFRRKTTDESKR
ncbi:unnamed protein product [Soboliphyme baturini]|uniref:Secreted protein n=1 Tax=Soboliphyme baturini TaxID=241478 RepID=A0A183IQP7_9BILA|nr:unnamed protein product [Soboliphyme baturini]